jgi:hypothetical protein
VDAGAQGDVGFAHFFLGNFASWDWGLGRVINQMPVTDKVLGLNFEQHIGTLQIMTLSGRQVKARGVAQRVDRGVNLGAQSAPAAPDGLLTQTPFFAPALCWCARTMVLSIMAYSLSAS